METVFVSAKDIKVTTTQSKDADKGKYNILGIGKITFDGFAKKFAKSRLSIKSRCFTVTVVGRQQNVYKIEIIKEIETQ